jgi:hypothetical protein
MGPKIDGRHMDRRQGGIDMTTKRLTVAGNPAGEWNARLERTCWGLFLVLLGSVALLERYGLRHGLLALGVGLILLGLNAVRYRAGVRISGFTTVVGLVALSTGLGDLTGWDLPTLPLVLIVVGAGMILRHAAARRDERPEVFSEQV